MPLVQAFVPICSTAISGLPLATGLMWSIRSSEVAPGRGCTFTVSSFLDRSFSFIPFRIESPTIMTLVEDCSWLVFNTARKSGKISYLLKAFFVRQSSEYETSDGDRKVNQTLHSQMWIHMVR